MRKIALLSSAAMLLSGCNVVMECGCRHGGRTAVPPSVSQKTSTMSSAGPTVSVVSRRMGICECEEAKAAAAGIVPEKRMGVCECEEAKAAAAGIVPERRMGVCERVNAAAAAEAMAVASSQSRVANGSEACRFEPSVPPTGTELSPTDKLKYSK